MAQEVNSQKEEIAALKKEVAEKAAGGGAWRVPFFVLFLLFLALAGIGYNRYRKITPDDLGHRLLAHGWDFRRDPGPPVRFGEKVSLRRP